MKPTGIVYTTHKTLITPHVVFYGNTFTESRKGAEVVL